MLYTAFALQPDIVAKAQEKRLSCFHQTAFISCISYAAFMIALVAAWLIILAKYLGMQQSARSAAPEYLRISTNSREFPSDD
jgi:hypothetical protein